MLNHSTVVPRNAPIHEIAIGLRVDHGSPDGAIAVATQHVVEHMDDVNVTDAIGNVVDSETSDVTLFVEKPGGINPDRFPDGDSVSLVEVEDFGDDGVFRCECGTPMEKVQLESYTGEWVCPNCEPMDFPGVRA